MSKNKDIEKKLEKEIEKKIEKEFRKDKLEKPELKEKPEKREHKEFKDFKEGKEIKEGKEKPERKEFKEAIKEKVEQKEIKELEKQVFEKGGKEIAEQVDPGDIFTLPTRSANLGAEADFSTAAAPKPKETDKTIEKIKAEKENLEKLHKEIEKIKPEKEFSKHEIKEFKHEKIEHKELKIEKHEIKEFKHEKLEIAEKFVFENDPKGIVENPGGGFPGGDPATKGPLFKGAGPAEDRLAELEDAVTRLTHFIGVDLRPDLSEGALKSEPDVANEKSGEAKPDDKSKKPR
jgi:hypothetical protein